MYPTAIADRYDVLTEIGRGGFATVYRAHDRLFDRDVAIKVLAADELRGDARPRFLREVQILARLEHPHILHVYDAGEWEGRPYFVTEFVAGETLERHLANEGTLPLDEALGIAREVASALAFAHERGIVHRDVKPANILLGSGGARLGDFGVARDTELTDPARMTSVGIAIGTVQYMSPEQLCAEPDVDGRSDQYALALVLYEMLAGTPPHQAKTVEGLRALRLRGDTVPVRTVRPAVPPLVEQALSRALAPTPADRFRSVRELLAVLEAVGTADLQVVSLGGSGASLTPVSATPGSVTAAALTPSDVTPSPARGAPASDATTRDAQRRRRTLLGAGGLAVLLGAWALAARTGPGNAAQPEAGTAEANTIALVAPQSALDSTVTEVLRAELLGWTGLSIDADVAVPRDARGEAGSTALLSAASERGGMGLIRASATDDGDSLRVLLERAEPSRGAVMRVVMVHARDARLTPAHVRPYSVRLLAGAAADSAPGLDALTEPHLPALLAYVDGWRRLRAGALDAARASFATSADAARSFDAAARWAAQLGAWTNPRDSDGWRRFAERSHAASGTVPLDSLEVDDLHSAALLAMADADYPTACRAFDRWRRLEPEAFVAWFGLGECQRLDRMVVRGAGPDTALRFRSSHWQAYDAYREALRRVPAEGLSIVFESTLGVIHAAGNDVRRGVGVDSAPYGAFASVEGDAVVFRPIAFAALQSAAGGSVPATQSAALARERRRLIEFTRAWVRAAPSLASAWRHHAAALELAGALDGPDAETSAAAALARAVALATDPEERVVLDVAQVRVAVRQGAREEALRLARSAIDRAPAATARIAQLQAPLAALLGDGDATARLLQQASADPTLRTALPAWASATELPRWLADSLRVFGVRAAIGECAGLARLRNALDEGLQRNSARAELETLRQALFLDAYRAAVPCVGASALERLRPVALVDRAIGSLAAGDTAAARRTLESLDEVRRGLRASSVAPEFVLIEAWAWEQLGSAERARDLRATLANDLAGLSAQALDFVPPAAAVGRVLRDGMTPSPTPRIP